MKTIGAIEASKQRVLAWSNFLLDTFRELGISDTEVINHCHIGRSTFYYMQQGELINADAYVRLKNYAIRRYGNKRRTDCFRAISGRDGKGQ